jgi:hypothetical protein
MNPQKVEAIVHWLAPKPIKDVCAFVGFANFYRQFIDNFSTNVAPLIWLTQKDIPFVFDPHCHNAVEQLKLAFTQAPILQHFDPNLPCIVEANSSDYCTGGVLPQRDSNGILRSVAYFLH